MLFEEPAWMMQVGGVRDVCFPAVDCDLNISFSSLLCFLAPVIRDFRLGGFHVVKTRRGYLVLFTHDAGRPQGEVDSILLAFSEAGLCDRKYFEAGAQGWRGIRFQGKYREKDLRYLRFVESGFPGEPASYTPLLDALIIRLYRAEKA